MGTCRTAGRAGAVTARATPIGPPDATRIPAAVPPQTTTPRLAKAAMPVRKLTSSSQANTAPRSAAGLSQAG
ncbi:MAG TPA: hypothetical protein VGI74_23260 [Streptosporangiaceae bacterium]